MGSDNPFFGKRHSEDYILHMRAVNTGSANPMYGIIRIGENAPGWRGGLTPLSKGIRSLDKYETWRFGVYTRDRFICQECGAIGVYLECHHIIPLSEIVSIHNIKNIDDALSCDFLWDIDNGLTTCTPCHCKIDEERNKFEHREV